MVIKTLSVAGKNIQPKVGKKGRIILFYYYDFRLKWPIISVFVNIQIRCYKNNSE